jgi:hypothetical protein
MHLLKPLNNILGFKIENQLRIKSKTHFYNIRGQIVMYKNSEIGSANKLSFPCSNNQQKISIIRCKLLTMQPFQISKQIQLQFKDRKNLNCFTPKVQNIQIYLFINKKSLHIITSNGNLISK